MSPKNSLLTVGLTALGMLGFAATRAATPGDLPAPPDLSAAPAPSAPPSVLLKSNGQILVGAITREEGKYVVHLPGGEIRVPEFEVEGAFPSVAAIYKHKLASIPDNDPDEHLKLARWCLSQKLSAEAKFELKLVLALSPSAREAKSMLAWMESSEARLAARPRVDTGVVQTSGERVNRPARASLEAPAEIDPSVLNQARREMGVKGIPVVFDLPPAVATRRADEFARFVHPVLQNACAKCHNEQHEGKFQLVEVRSRREMTANVLRSNLDATLQLIDPENPVHSELLSSTLLPHGKGPNQRPIFRGSNDPRFQILVTWVTSLRRGSNRSQPDGRLTNAAASAPSAFAADRGQDPVSSTLPAPLTNPVKAYPLNPKTETPPPARYVPGRGMVAEKNPPSPDEFPAPFLLGGPKPKLDVGTKPATAQVGKRSPSLPPLPPGLPPDDPTLSPPSSKLKKPVKFDPALLEKALIQRNAEPR